MSRQKTFPQHSSDSVFTGSHSEVLTYIYENVILKILKLLNWWQFFCTYLLVHFLWFKESDFLILQTAKDWVAGQVPQMWWCAVRSGLSYTSQGGDEWA
jgi:hypothetical protein